jgi:uncharacterized membrane protein
MEEAALFLHLLGAFLFTGGLLVAATAFEAARRRSRPAEVALLLSLAPLAVIAVALGALLAGAFGLWLVDLGHRGYGASWVDAAIALFVVVLALGGASGGRPKRARLLAQELAERDEPMNGELRSLLDDPITRTLNYMAALLVIAIIALMVFKP